MFRSLCTPTFDSVGKAADAERKFRSLCTSKVAGKVREFESSDGSPCEASDDVCTVELLHWCAKVHALKRNLTFMPWCAEIRSPWSET